MSELKSIFEMSWRSIFAGEVWTPEEHFANCLVRIREGRIESIEPNTVLRGEDVFDASDKIVIPGLVDLQVNGALGWSFQAGDRAHFSDIAEFHAARGTTAFLPTLVSAPEQVLLAGLAAVAEFIETSPYTLPGIHLEGPFLAPERRGAHDPKSLLLPDLDLMRRLVDAARGHLKLVTLAPELPGALELIAFLRGEGIRVAAGHSAATFAQMQRAVDAGLDMVTHAGNVSDWPHRALGELGFMTSEPGVVGALMTLERLHGSLILDGFHFHPALLAPLLKLRGADNLFLVSDASPAVGCPPGDYSLGGLDLTVHPAGFATSQHNPNMLAGSLITLLDAVQRAEQLAHIPFATALQMATLGPARYLGIQEQCGRIAVGAPAALVVLDGKRKLAAVFSE